jgi:hypothetical protein
MWMKFLIPRPGSFPFLDERWRRLGGKQSSTFRQGLRSPEKALAVEVEGRVDPSRLCMFEAQRVTPWAWFCNRDSSTKASNHQKLEPAKRALRLG